MTGQDKRTIFAFLRAVSGSAYGFTTRQFQEEIDFTNDEKKEETYSQDGQNHEFADGTQSPLSHSEPEVRISNPVSSIKYDSIGVIAQKIASCTACKLASTRKNVVPGTGAENPDVLIIGEGPGEEEDRQGLPFVGRAGQLLDKMLNAIELDRKANCFIANIVKCRPPKNRDPEPDECASCRTFLDAQIAALQPKMILTMGRIASHNLLNTENSIGRLRSRFYEYKNIPLLVTYHPSALLRNADLKRPAWEDLKLFKSRLLTLSPDYAARFHRLIGRPQ
ncbi:MAG: uracil-DNA glycosylase [Treponema sp.]